MRQATGSGGERPARAEAVELPVAPVTRNMRDWFHWFASSVSLVLGTPWAFVVALGVIVLWVASGPLFHFSDTWQLVINTATTIVTFLMVFLIQNTQNRDARALHLKLDELIRANRRARNGLIELESSNEHELDALAVDFHRLRNGPPSGRG